MRRARLRNFIGLVAALTALPGAGIAQTEDSSPPGSEVVWGLSAGWVRQGVSDELASPLRYRGSGVHFALARESRSLDVQWGIEAVYLAPTLESSLADRDGGLEETEQGRVVAHYLRRVGTGLGGRVAFRAGGGLDARLFIREHHYNALQSERFGDLFAPLSAAASWETRVPGGRLSHRVGFPLLALVMRSPYSGLKFVPDVEIAPGWRFVGVTSHLEYGLGTEGRFGVAVFHDFGTFRYPDPYPIAMAGHRVGVRLEVER